MTPCSKGLRPADTQKHPLQITTRTPKEPDFKFELLPLHSPLLRQSLLVSFPPLIDMLKFSGYSYLIRGQPCEKRLYGGGQPVLLTFRNLTRRGSVSSPMHFGRASADGGPAPNTKRGLIGEMTLEQACPSEYQGAQCAFKDSMIH